jgi:hypothetical protein
MKNTTKKEAKQIKKIAKEMAKHVGEIDYLFNTYRKIVGYEYLDIPFCEEDEVVWTDDEDEMAESMINSLVRTRAVWKRMEMMKLMM